MRLVGKLKRFHDMKKCECGVCKRNRLFQQHLENVSSESRQFFEQLYDAFLETEMDRDYYKVIVDGTWPNADEVIKHVRSKVNQ